MKKFSLITMVLSILLYSCSKESTSDRNSENFETALIEYQNTNKSFNSSLEYSQNLIGTLNNQTVDWDVWSSINTENGETYSKAYFNESEYRAAMVTIIITFKCFIANPGPEGIESMIDLMNGDSYTRELKYKFANGDEINVHTDASLNESHAISNITGKFPDDFVSDFQESGSLSLSEPADFIVENIEGEGIMYSGIAKYKIGNNEYEILIESKYLYDVQNELSQSYIFTIESDNTFIDSESPSELNKIAKFSKSNI
jgi:hypothetical protein